jgi:hypothetical protein
MRAPSPLPALPHHDARARRGLWNGVELIFCCP